MLFDSKSSLYLFYSWFVNSRTLRISFHSFIENELFYIKVVNYSNLVYKSTKYLVYNRYSNILNDKFFCSELFGVFINPFTYYHVSLVLLVSRYLSLLCIGFWIMNTCFFLCVCVCVCVCEFLNVLSTYIHGTDPINVFSSKKFWDSHPKRRWWKDLS